MIAYLPSPQGGDLSPSSLDFCSYWLQRLILLPQSFLVDLSLVPVLPLRSMIFYQSRWSCLV
jgi:hypothetical protein